MWKPTAFLLALLLPGVVPAEVYRWVSPEGTVFYSDKPWGQGAERVALPPLTTIPAPTRGMDLRPSTPRLAQAEGEPAALGYQSFAFASPVTDQAVRANDGVVQVSLRLKPFLHAGHRIAVHLDGAPVPAATGLQFSIPDMARGTHTLSAAVVDGVGEVQIQAPPVTFHVLRVALGGAKTAP